MVGFVDSDYIEDYSPGGSTGGGITIGATVTGGTPNEVLYVDGSGNIADSSNFTFDGTNLNVKSFETVLYANMFSGSDMGAQINAAYAYAVAQGWKGVVITLPATAYSFSTPIVIGNDGFRATIRGVAGDGTYLTYTGLTSTAAITINCGYQGDSAGSEHITYNALQDITLKGNDGTSASAKVGILLGNISQTFTWNDAVNSGTGTFGGAFGNNSTGTPIQLTTSGTLPAGLSTSTTYYIIRVSATTFQLATTLANALASVAIVTTTNGTGTQTIGTLKNGAAGAVLRNVKSETFGQCLVFGGNTYHTLCDSVVLRNGAQLMYVNAASNSGESLRFLNCFMVDPFDTTYVTANGVQFADSATASCSFFGCSFDDTQVRIGQANNVSFFGTHWENPGSANWGAYIYLSIDSNLATNVSLNGDTFFNTGTTAPTEYILNGGNVTMNGVIVRQFSGGITNFGVLQGSGRFTWHGLNNVSGTAFTNVVSGVAYTPSGFVNQAGNVMTLDASAVQTTTNSVVGTQTTGDNSTKAASTAFVTTAVNNAIAGVNPAVAVAYATVAAADTSGLTYNNGVSGVGATFTGANNTAIVIDGHTFVTGDVGVTRVLIKNDTQSPSGAFNGVYLFTALQTAGTGAIFTRATDYNTPSEINNSGIVPVINGTANADTSWILTTVVTTVGTSPLSYTQFSLAPTTLVTLTGTQTLTNKTLTGATNTITASLLKSATTEVNVSSATAPSSGQVLTATSSTAATWQAPPGLVSVKSYGATGNGTTDDTTAIQNAIASGQSIFFPDGTYLYTSTTAIQMTNGNQQIVGADTGAVINLAPTSAMTNGILCQAFDVGIKNISININLHVVNAIRINGNGQRGIIDHIIVTGTGTSGQCGIYMDATTPANYFYKIINSTFNTLPICISLQNASNAQFINNCNFSSFTTGISCDSELCMFSNIFGQTQGSSVIEFTSNGKSNSSVNIMGEAASAPTVLLDSGSSFNHIVSVINTGGGAAITDNGTSNVKYN